MNDSSSLRHRIGLVLGPTLFAAMLIVPAPAGLSRAGWLTAAMAVLMATWWVTEALPISATALVPLVLLPVFGILPIPDAAAPYANPVIFLFMGGFMIAVALERCGLHSRLALEIIKFVGTKPASLIGGFMAATAFLSLWVSNTATVVIMFPVALSLIEIEEQEPTSRNFSVALLLGLAYAANIGGIGTLIGTPPNALLAGFLNESYGLQIGFAQWMMFGVPLVLVAVPVTWLLLTRFLYPVGEKKLSGGNAFVDSAVRSLGRLSRREKTVGAITILVALSWVLQPVIARYATGVSDTVIAIAGALLLFMVPVRWKPLEASITWREAEKLPWSVLVLFGGGLSLANAIQTTGLAEWIGRSVSTLGPLPLILVTLIVTTTIVFLTELTSNTATAAAFLPVVAATAIGMGASPLLLAIPTAVGASCAFMMPVATPPNALVYGSGRITIPQMVRAGIWLNFLLIGIIVCAVFLLAPVVFGF